MASPLDLWNRHLISRDNSRQFVDCKLLDEVAGKELLNKFRTMELIVSEMVAGTDLQPQELLRKIAMRRQRTRSVCVAARIMQLILLRGFKDIPWNEARRGLVEQFFSADIIPDIDPYKARNTVAVSITLFGYK